METIANPTGRTVAGQEHSAEDDSQLALEFKEVLRDLANDLAQTVAAPSVTGLAGAVRAELGVAVDQLSADFGRELTALRTEQSGLLTEVHSQLESLRAEATNRLAEELRHGLQQTGTDLESLVSERLTPLVQRLDRLDLLEQGLRAAAADSCAAGAQATQQIGRQVDGFVQASESVLTSMTLAARQLGEGSDTVRTAVGQAVPALDAAARGVQSGQESLRNMLRTYNDTLDRSLTALETKFAGLLASHLERASQRQSDIEVRVRATAERTEEAVVDLMHGNQAHHQAMVEGTAASLSQLELLNRSFSQATSSLRAITFMAAGSLAGVLGVLYLLLAVR